MGAGFFVDPYGNIYTSETNSQYSRVQKFDNLGRLIRKYESFGADAKHEFLSGIAVDKRGNIYRIDTYEKCIRKISATGEFITKIGSQGSGEGQLIRPIKIAVDQSENIYVVEEFDTFNFKVIKFNSKGEFVMQFTKPDPLYMTRLNSLAVDKVGNIFVGDDNQIYKFDSFGKYLFKLNAPNDAIAVSQDGNKIAAAYAYFHSIYIYTSSSYMPLKENFITGNTYHDINNNCTKDIGEKGISGIIVVAEPGPYYGVTDEQGNYTIPVDTGSYTVQQLLPNQNGRSIIQNCPANSASFTVQFSTYNNTISGKSFGNQVNVAPYLSTSVSSNRRRRCFTNTTTVTYANSGFAPAANVKVYVQLPQYLVLKLADKPYIKDSSGNLIFDIGSLNPNQAGSITIQDSVVCNDSSIRGLTQCTKVWVLPILILPLAIGTTLILLLQANVLKMV
jgi:hypothetical protein